MTFTILSDAHIKQLLHGLESHDVTGLARCLSEALFQYSCNNEKEYQPGRSVITRPGMHVSLFMPATTKNFIGTKIVGISPSKGPDPLSRHIKPSLRSALTICDASGHGVGVLNATDLTAFRTALGSIILYSLRKSTENIVVFGAGKQALWHIRLAVTLRGNDIRKVTVVNRSSQRTQELFSTLRESWPSHIILEAFEGSFGVGNTLEDLMASADVTFCTTPSTKPLFPALYLSSNKGQRKSQYISAIGSYCRDMIEIDPELLKTVVAPSSSLPDQSWLGRIIVDSVDGCLKEAGEVIAAGIKSHQLLELGKIEELKNSDGQNDLQTWLESGFVIYKSVGIGTMDITLGTKMLQLAQAKNIGVHLDSF